jgi:hypothetical protein
MKTTGVFGKTLSEELGVKKEQQELHEEMKQLQLAAS